MLLHSWTNTKGALRVELLEGDNVGQSFRLSDSGEISALMTRAEAESLRDQLNALIPSQRMKEAA